MAVDCVQVPSARVPTNPLAVVRALDALMPPAVHDPGHEHETPKKADVSDGLSATPDRAAGDQVAPEYVSTRGAIPDPAVEV